jgi:hypothetical protein
LKYNLKFFLNTLIAIGLLIVLVSGVIKMLKTGINISLCFYVNDILLDCSFLIFLNSNIKLGALLANISFLVFLILVFVFSPHRLFQISTFIRLIVSIYLVYYIKHKASHLRR